MAPNIAQNHKAKDGPDGQRKILFDFGERMHAKIATPPIGMAQAIYEQNGRFSSGQRQKMLVKARLHGPDTLGGGP